MLTAALILTAAGESQAQFTPPPASLQSSPIPRMAPPTLPQVGPGAGELSLGPLDNNAPDQPILVRGVTVDGYTVYTKDEIDRLVDGLVGTTIPLRNIEAARLALVKKYRDAGYPLVSVQATRRSDGTLRFVVYEGRITSVKLDGDDIGPAGTQVLRFLNRLMDPGPVNAAKGQTAPDPVRADDLERWLLLAQDVPGIALQAVLRPNETDPGAITLIATVKRSPVSAMYTADNRAYPLTGPSQQLAIVNFNSFTSLGERTELSLYSTFNGTQIFGQAATEIFAGSSGLRFRLYGGAGNVTPSGFLRQLGYNGFTTVGGISAIYPVIRAREQTLNVIGAFDILDSVITTAPSVGGVQSPRAPASKDSLRVFRLGADYALRDIFVDATKPAINSALIRLSQGISALGATHNTSTPARVNEKIDFTKVAGEISRNQTLFQPWSNATVSLLGLVAGQGSGDILPPAEKFYLGGYRFTRGFYSGQASGDSAIAATAELQLTVGTEVTALGYSFDLSTQYYLFYDYGQAWQNVKTEPNKEMKSFGLGARVQITRHVEFDLEGVKRITRNVDGANASQLQEYAVYWRVLTRF